MKRLLHFIVISMVVALLLQAFTSSRGTTSYSGTILRQKQLNPGFPDSVDYIITHICMICHSDQSDNERARFKLNFSKWDEMKGLAQIGKLDNISKMLREDKMPPPKFIERNPSKALTESQRALMIHWADDEIKKLMKP